MSQSLSLGLSYQLIEYYLGAPVILASLYKIKLSRASVTETISSVSLSQLKSKQKTNSDKINFVKSELDVENSNATKVRRISVENIVQKMKPSSIKWPDHSGDSRYI